MDQVDAAVRVVGAHQPEQLACQIELGAAGLAGRHSLASTGRHAAFDQIFDEVRAAAYQVELWGAASLINDGCSDDGFEDFRGWLIGRGRNVYQAALRDADWLASLPQVTGRRHPHRP